MPLSMIAGGTALADERMDLPLDRATATADLLSDIFPPGVRRLGALDDVPSARLWDMSDADLCALVRVLDRDLIARGKLGLTSTVAGREILARRMVALAVLQTKVSSGS